MIGDTEIDVMAGVNGEVAFHLEEFKLLTEEFNFAFSELRKWNWDYRGRMFHMIYDICCGPGKCVPLYV